MTFLGVTTTTEVDLAQEAIAAFQKWVTAVATGCDTDGAWGMIASRSRMALGTYAQSDEMYTWMAKGWGSWVVMDEPSFPLEEHEAGWTVLIASGVVHPEGWAEWEVPVPMVTEDGEDPRVAIQGSRNVTPAG